MSFLVTLPSNPLPFKDSKTSWLIPSFCAILLTSGEKYLPLEPFLEIFMTSFPFEGMAKSISGSKIFSVTGSSVGVAVCESLSSSRGCASPSVEIIAITSPTCATSSFLKSCFTRTPSASEGNSLSTLSVATSTKGSSKETVSPGFFNQFVIVASVTLSPIFGSLISISAIGF